MLLVICYNMAWHGSFPTIRNLPEREKPHEVNMTNLMFTHDQSRGSIPHVMPDMCM